MNDLDWLLIAIVVLSAVMAAAQGFFVELFSLAGAIGGFILAAWQYGTVAVWYGGYFKNEWAANIAGFLTIYFGVLLICGFAGRLARWAFKEAGLRWVDRALGAAFGVLRGAVVATVLTMAIASFAPTSPRLAGSEIAPYLLAVGQAGAWLGPSSLRQALHEGMNELRGLGKQAPAKPAAAQPAKK